MDLKTFKMQKESFILRHFKTFCNFFVYQFSYCDLRSRKMWTLSDKLGWGTHFSLVFEALLPKRATIELSFYDLVQVRMLFDNYLFFVSGVSTMQTSALSLSHQLRGIVAVRHYWAESNKAERSYVE